MKEPGVYTASNCSALLEDLPPICAEFFRGIEPSTSVLTRYGYALDLKLFFKFLISDSLCSGLLSIRDIDCSILENVSIDHIERYLEYVAMYPAETDSEDYEKKNILQTVNEPRRVNSLLYALFLSIFIKKEE